MHKPFLTTASLLGALAVLLGAFAAHTLKSKLTPEALTIFETGVRYHFYHVFALFAAAILYKEFPNKLIRYSGTLFILGIIFFSLSLYLLSLSKGFGKDQFNWLGAITPIGGACFIAGWVLMFLGCRKR